MGLVYFLCFIDFLSLNKLHLQGRISVQRSNHTTSSVVVWMRTFLQCLTTWPLVAVTVWGGLGGVILLEEVCHRGWALRSKASPNPWFALFALWLRFKMWALSFLRYSYPPGTVRQRKRSFCKLPWSCFFFLIYYGNRKVIKTLPNAELLRQAIFVPSALVEK